MSGAARGPCDEGIVETTVPVPCAKSSGRWIVAATVLGSSMAFIDGSVVNVALPVIQARLHASVADVQWIVEAYSLALSSLVLLGGAIGDRIGRRRAFTAGIVLFALSSAACGLAGNLGILVAARAVQGIGAALMIPTSLAILGAAFSPAERGRVVGTWSALTSAASAIGPLAGGWLVMVGSWRAAFYLNLPVAALVLWITRRKIPESPDSGSGRLDLAGALLSTGGLALVVFGLIEVPSAGWASVPVRIALLAGAACLAAFGAVEWKTSHPMVRLALFRSRTFSGINLLTFFLYAALSIVFFVLPFELIQGRGYSPAVAGAAFLPTIALMFLLSRPAGAIADRFGVRLPLIAGPATAAIGFLMLEFSHREGSFALEIFPALCVVGLGMAFTVAPLTAAVLNAVDRIEAGAASGINNAVARVASLLAIATIGIAASTSGSLTASFRVSMRLAAGLAVLASVAGMLVQETVTVDSKSKIGRV